MQYYDKMVDFCDTVNCAVKRVHRSAISGNLSVWSVFQKSGNDFVKNFPENFPLCHNHLSLF